MMRYTLDNEMNTLGCLIFMEKRNIAIELKITPSRKEKDHLSLWAAINSPLKMVSVGDVAS